MLTEAIVRRALSKRDYLLRKTPSRHWTREYYGTGYMVLDINNNIVLGAFQREYEATLTDVQNWLNSLNIEEKHAA